MLMSLGPIVFDLVTNIDETETRQRSSFARHDVVDAGPVYEATGDDEGTIRLSGTIHPTHFGGLASLDVLEAARASKIPLPLMRGDFSPLGWVVIDGVESNATLLTHQGIGREIRFTVDLIRTSNPGIGAAASILRLFQ